MLPPLRIQGQPARAHTQGMELVAGKYFVTARRDDVRPKRALLLRTEPAGTGWDVWDITPIDAQGEITTLDHPGGMQSDGDRLWIPLAESKRKGRSLIRVFRMAGIVPGPPLKADLEFPVNDHIGAVAVSTGHKIVFGANWDTETVYVWDFDGRLQRTLNGPELQSRGLGVANGVKDRAGLAVQDWKVVGDRLFASGLFRGPGTVADSPQSRLMSFAGFSEPGFQRWSIPLPKQNGTELAREAMAISDGRVHFLPDDLGASNRIFRVSLADLMERSVSQDWRGGAVETPSSNAVTAPPNVKDLSSTVKVKLATEGHRPLPRTGMGLRGVFFNPQVKQRESPEFPWLLFYPQCRSEVRTHLKELVATTDINFLSIFVNIAHSLKQPSQPPQTGQPFSAWANTAYLDNVAAFIDDCHTAGVSVEIDLACNLWVPRSVDPKHQIANSGKWPMPGESPWIESAPWYRETITYIEGKTRHPERIAMWCMMGNHEFGEAEPCLWDRDDNPAIAAGAEKFVKYVWPIFRSAGKRPKAPPIMLPIFSNTPFWMARSPKARLSAFANLKKWIIDDLAQPPDYWVMTTYPFCDPAPDGFPYLRAIIEILGPENAGRIVSTDLKGPGHDQELRDSIILPPGGQSGVEMLNWHFQKSAEYGFAGWWVWAYQDTPKATTGIRNLTGTWKRELVRGIKQEAAKAHQP